MSAIRVVLSDLDDTLFDHHRATRAALSAVMAGSGVFSEWSPGELERRHRDLLETLHVEVLAGRLSIDDARVERFQRLLVASSANASVECAGDIARHYRRAYEQCWHPVPGALELVALTRRAGLSIVVVTNNSVLEQQQKLERTGLSPFVDRLVASEEIGCCKPEPEIFHAALGHAGVSVGEAVMLGDAWATDIEGARRIGLRAVWLNRFGLTSPDKSVPELAGLEPAAHAARTILNSEL
jgi:HAD superfamily hydrolase (TIGR01549 family)